MFQATGEHSDHVRIGREYEQQYHPDKIQSLCLPI